MPGPVFFENVQEFTTTAGSSRPYYLNGSVSGGSRGLFGTMADGDWAYFSVTDGVRWETIRGEFHEPNRVEIINGVPVAGSSGIDNVDWPTSGQRIISLISAGQTADGSVIVSPEEDDFQFWSSVMAGLIFDLGTISETSSQIVDMGLISGVDDDSASLDIDLGLISDASIESDDERTFWMVVELGGGDLGKITDQSSVLIDAGLISDVGVFGAALIDLGEIS